MEENIQKKILLNFIYLGRQHAGGKDQVALNLLEGWVVNGDTENVVVICFDYLVDTIRNITKDILIEAIPYTGSENEFSRLLTIERVNTFILPKLVKKYQGKVVFHASCTNGLRKIKGVSSIVIPHDIKAVSHRVLGNVKISWYKYILYRIMYKIDFRNADKIIAISETDKQEIKKYYPGYAEKVVKIYNPIKVKEDGKTVCKKRNHNIVAVNLQFHHKNIITLIKAYEKIQDEIDGNLVLVGNIPQRVDYLKRYVKTHHLEERVEFTGFVTGEQKRKLLLECGLYVNCSLFEGFGMTAVEAMIMDTPALLSKIPTNYEVTAGLCSYYEPVDDADALAQAILDCFQKPLDMAQLKERRETMLRLYDYRNIAKQYMELFWDEKNGRD